MYLEHFGLKHPPFKITPDTSLFYPGGNRGTVLEALVYAITSGEGIIKVVGEVGSGKTMLCRMLELELPNSVEIVYLANPRLSPDNILQVIAFELKLPISETDNRLVAMRALQDYLLERHAENRQVVIFVEEAQSMPLATLEEIRLLSNLETGQNKLLQMVMFGQPELDEQLARPQIRQLRERITHNFKLGPLSRNEIRDYLNARLRSCGYRGGNLFSNAAIALITRYSQGLLRRINILADKALLSAYAGNKRRVGRRQVMAAVRDSEMRPAWTAWLWPAIALIVLAVVVVAARPYFPGMNLAIFIKPAEEPTQPAVIESTSDPETTKSNRVESPASQPQHEPEAAAISEPAPTASDDVDAALTPENTDEFETGSIIETQVAVPEILNDSEVGISDSSLIQVDVHDSTNPAVIEPVNILAATSYMNTSSRDIERLLAQIEQFPPEDIWLDEPDPAATCRLCTTIIYRPLKNNENL